MLLLLLLLMLLMIFLEKNGSFVKVERFLLHLEFEGVLCFFLYIRV